MKSYEERMGLLPHLKDYEQAKPSFWLPFVMDTLEPNISSGAMNSDPLGFRYTIDARGEKLSPATDAEGPVSLLIGGSTVLGVGATSDRKTISSLLAARRNEAWLNLGVRGATLAQNFYQYLVFRSLIGPVRRIVLLAGWNDVTSFMMAPLFTRHYGVFHGFTEYFRTMNAPQVGFGRGHIDFPRRWSSLIEFSDGRDAVRSAFCEHIRDTLDNWKFVADGMGANISFVAQPMAFHCPHRLTPEELNWFETKTNIPTLKRAAQPYKDWHIGSLAEACVRLGIPFEDSNESFGESVDDSLFIDPMHLTDRGYEEMANLVERMFVTAESGT